MGKRKRSVLQSHVVARLRFKTIKNEIEYGSNIDNHCHCLHHEEARQKEETLKAHALG